MSDAEKIPIPKPEGYFCFACGTANPIGLNLEFYRSGDKVCTDITLGEYHVGWSNISHGGVLSTLLDEVMSWAILYFKRIFFVTRKMQIKYIRPVLVGTPLKVVGQVIGQNESSIKAKAEIFDASGNLLARSTGEFVTIGDRKLSFIDDESKREIYSLIEKLPPL